MGRLVSLFAFSGHFNSGHCWPFDLTQVSIAQGCCPKAASTETSGWKYKVGKKGQPLSVLQSSCPSASKTRREPDKHLTCDHVSILLPQNAFYFLLLCFVFWEFPFTIFSSFFKISILFLGLYRILLFLFLEYLTGHAHQNQLLRLKKKKCGCSFSTQSYWNRSYVAGLRDECILKTHMGLWCAGLAKNRWFHSSSALF